MSAKDLIDGVRRDFSIPLGLNRSRDVIALLIYGSPYSAALAAENDGKLCPPSLTDERTESLASTHGAWVRELAEVARPHVVAIDAPFDFLSVKSLLALTHLSAKRDADGLVFYEPSALSPDPPAWAAKLTADLEDQLSHIDPEALIELSALVVLGREEGGSYGGLLRQARANRGFGCLTAWLSAMPIHRYVAKGLEKMGQPGAAVFARSPELSEWLLEPPPAAPVAEVPSLEVFAQLEQDLKALVGKNRRFKPFEFYVRSTCQKLDLVGDLDYFGCDEQIPYLMVGYAKREHAVICICGDLEIGKAYFYLGDLEAAAQRLSHARTFVADLARTIETGAPVAQHASAGGEAKALKLLPLKREFMRLIEVRRPTGGWSSQERTAAALRDLMLKANDALEGGPVLSDSLESTLETWLSKDEEIRKVYFLNRRAKASS